MQWSTSNIAVLLCTLSFSTLQAQQPQQAPPSPGPATNAARPLNAPPVFDHTGAMQNPRVQLQPNQRGLVNRDAQRQGMPPQGNMNNRDPRERIAAEQRIQEQMRDQGDQQGSETEQVDSNALLYSGGGGSYYGGSGAVTAAQAQVLAESEFVRSAGEFNRNTAAAEVLHEEARSRAISNSREAVDNYFDVRRLNRQLRNEERGPMPTQEDVLRYSQDRVPDRLPLAALDRHSGAIHWPAVLMRPEFDQHRTRLEQIFQGRSYYNSGAASQSYLEIKDETNRMLLTLQDRVYEMDAFAYVQAKKFIKSLGYEGRFVAGNDSLARR